MKTFRELALMQSRMSADRMSKLLHLDAAPTIVVAKEFAMLAERLAALYGGAIFAAVGEAMHKTYRVRSGFCTECKGLDPNVAITGTHLCEACEAIEVAEMAKIDIEDDEEADA